MIEMSESFQCNISKNVLRIYSPTDCKQNYIYVQIILANAAWYVLCSDLKMQSS